MICVAITTLLGSLSSNFNMLMKKWQSFILGAKISNSAQSDVKVSSSK